MENRVGSKIPSTSEVTKIVNEIEGIATKLSSFTIELTPEERRRVLRFRPGGEAVVELVGELVTKRGVSLPNISVDDMNADLDLAQRLAPIAAALSGLTQVVADTMLEAHAECWYAATAFYTVLSRLGGTEPKLMRELRPAIEFFAQGKRAPKSTPAPAADKEVTTTTT